MSLPASILHPNRQDYKDSLANQITLLAGQINAANHRLLKLIAEFDHSKGWSGGGTVRSCAHWLNWKCGIALGAAREKVRVAHCLEKLPQIDAAFARGEISYSKVRAMTRVATPENEDYLMMIAEHGTASHMEKLVGKYHRVEESIKRRENARASENERDNARKLVYYRDDDGMWVIHAKLPPEAGEQVVKAIEAVVAPIQAERQQEILEANRARKRQNDALGDADNEPNSTSEKISAEMFSEAVEREDRDKGNRFQELLTHTRADALVIITEHFLATSRSGEDIRALKGAERCQIMLHVDAATLREQSEHGRGGPAHCEIEHNSWLNPATARRLACDASLVTVLDNENGDVLNIGRRSRTVPPNIRRALAIRDKTCRFPGCCESKYVDAHHIRHWADGGETSLDNLVTLCRYHHRLLHHDGFSIEVDKHRDNEASPALLFTTPAGTRIETSFFPQFPEISAETWEEALGDIAPEVNADNCKPYWTGEHPDYGMAVDGLLRRDRPRSGPGDSTLNP